ncbi:MAG TPA: amino acid permease [Niabella sp.]|nr:amino acid permease [Niabella sp.]HOZ95582.1 amino acid permease [Niabella sp.]HQW13822.1 amino acid permease [Niabella sp.]HQX19285.1 amino acid permease [Niabella sp.]HQX41637.1 amino acid permease [Niabella sp.]
MKKQLGLFDLTMIMISFVIGMGIFRTPVNVANATPDVFTYFLCWLAGGVVALCGALTYAEIGSRLPATGGYYRVFTYAYHPSIAFAINCIILVSNAASLAAVALVGSEYIIGVLFPNRADSQSIEVTFGIVSIILFYGINLMGLRMSSRTQNMLMLIKIGVVVLLVLPLFFADAAPVVDVTETSAAGIKEYVKSFGIGLVAVSFTYGGYQQTINFGEEVKHSSRTIPRSIFLGIIIIVLLYMLVNYAYIRVIGFEELKTSKNIAAIMASKLLGSKAEAILSVLLFLGVLGYINGSLLSNPRVMYAMSEDKVLPELCRQSNRKGVLSVSLSIFTALAVLVVFWAEEFDRILSFTIFLDCFGMALSAATIFVVRKRTAHLNHSGIFKMKLFPLLPVIFIIAYTFVAISIAMDYKNNNYAAFIGVSVMALFMLIYFIFLNPKAERK